MIRKVKKATVVNFIASATLDFATRLIATQRRRFFKKEERRPLRRAILIHLIEITTCNTLQFNNFFSSQNKWKGQAVNELFKDNVGSKLCFLCFTCTLCR